MAQKLTGKNFVLMMERDGEMVPVCCSRDLSIEIQSEIREATKAPFTAWRSFYAGNLTYTVSCSGLVIVDESYTLNDFFAMISNRQSLAFIAVSSETKDVFFSGKIILNTMSVNAPNKDVMTYSITATGDGPLGNTNPYDTIAIEDSDGSIMTDDEGNIIVEEVHGSLLPINYDINC
jgi:predicted secreted protein